MKIQKREIIPLLNWMDKKLSKRLITDKGITDKVEITHIKLTIWDFLKELEDKLLKKV